MLIRKRFVHGWERFFEIYMKMRRAQHSKAHRNSIVRFRANTIIWLRGGAMA